jgi:hypothetical protein
LTSLEKIFGTSTSFNSNRNVGEQREVEGRTHETESVKDTGSIPVAPQRKDIGMQF